MCSAQSCLRALVRVKLGINKSGETGPQFASSESNVEVVNCHAFA
uniref:Uncharacterized protein n=1 Tax=Anguilla anguilla TaxID=7936 RepID=A0A0E9VIN9_ANGAN